MEKLSKSQKDRLDEILTDILAEHGELFRRLAEGPSDPHRPQPIRSDIEYEAALDYVSELVGLLVDYKKGRE